MWLLIPLFIVAHVAFHIVCWLFVNWWAPLFADKDGWLPKWLSWVQTFDDTLDAGKRDGLYPNMSTYWARVFWLYRNTGYGFSYWVLGMRFQPELWDVKAYYVVPETGSFTFFAVGPCGAFNLHIVRGWLRLKIGWKAWNMWDEGVWCWQKHSWGPVWRIPFVFSISRANRK